MLRLITFGGLALQTSDGSPPPRVKQLRLGLLASIAAAGEHGITRERLAALFWPDSDEERARHSLRQAFYELRQELRCDVLIPGAALSLDPSAITSDVAEFRAAIAAGHRARAVSLVPGPFLDGFYVPAAGDFERWVEEERGRLQTATVQALIALAGEANSAGDLDAAVEWWRQLTAADPLSGRFALGYLKALAARGDRADALAFARTHESIVRRELEADPDPSVRQLEAELRAMPSPERARTPAPAAAPPTSARQHASSPDVPGTKSAVDPPQSLTEPGVTSAPETRTPYAPSRRRARLAGVVATLAAIVVASIAWQRGWLASGSRPTIDAPVFAVGMMREEGIPDSLRIGGVLTDMLGTNLARVEGMSVIANSRLLELMSPARDTSAAAYADAARRAGASEVVEGQLLVGPRWGLALEFQRTDLRTGLVRGAYRVSAPDRYALIDSATAAITRHLELDSPAGSVAEATTASSVAYRFYEEGMRAYYQYDHAAALRLMRAALAEDSAYAMAAFYEAMLAGMPAASVERALRLARRAPERERLTITAELAVRLQDVNGRAIAETLATKFPNEPHALATLAKALLADGDWPAAVSTLERALAIDSAAEVGGSDNCLTCDHYGQLGHVYHWWDSLPAADRVARRFRKAKPDISAPWFLVTLTAMKAGRAAEAVASYRKTSVSDPNAGNLGQWVRLNLMIEDYEEAERSVRRLLGSANSGLVGDGHWLLLIALRNQGRLEEARTLLRTGAYPGLPRPLAPKPVDRINEAIIASESGDLRGALSILLQGRPPDVPDTTTGVHARMQSWSRTIRGTTQAALGDTAGVRHLADTVEYWGARSPFGRDRKSHHFLRGLVHSAAGRDEDAVREYRAAVFSWSLGYTRVNYELGKVLMRLRRPQEAIAAVQPALRGEIDAANLYVTRSDLHELLAHAFDAAGMRDSAAVHYRALVKAWERADPRFHARREQARQWLEQRKQVQGRR